MKRTLYIAARAPRPGFTKTRLGSVIGHDRAAYLYAAFLRDLALRFNTAPFDVGWFVTPANSWPEIVPYVTTGNHPKAVISQPDGDWTARQRALFAAMDERNEVRTLLIASDSPQISVESVCHAFSLLEMHDVVLGPVHDGGYYLIGMRVPAACRVFDGVAMSKSDVLAQLITRAHEFGYSVGLAEPTFDVDEFNDLAALSAEALNRADLTVSRSALRALGLLPTQQIHRDLVFAGHEAKR